jgi:predicted nuclease with TOPRIM domain
VALQLLASANMAGQDFEHLLKDIFGEPLSRLNQFQSEQLGKLTTRVQDLAREAVKEELARLHVEVNELRSRIAALEAERAQVAADSVTPSF